MHHGEHHEHKNHHDQEEESDWQWQNDLLEINTAISI